MFSRKTRIIPYQVWYMDFFLVYLKRLEVEVGWLEPIASQEGFAQKKKPSARDGVSD
jgi:hypothetical protein